jgi:hypothetical protein
MSQLGYDPRAAITMLAKLDTGGRGGGLDKYLATHPAPKSRQTAVQQQIAKEKPAGCRTSCWWPAPDDGRKHLRADCLLVRASDMYPGDTNNSDTGADYYPPEAGASEYSTGQEVNFGAPLRLRASSETNESIVLAPVAGFARWAGATVSGDGA